MAYLRYAVCGCCLCIKNANCYKTGMIRPFDTYMHPPARQQEKDVHSAACCHAQRSKSHTPGRNAKKIGFSMHRLA